MSVRVRFAPSPTGYLHVGGLRTALYNYLYARHNKGKCILRIEDTDRTRFVENSMENLIDVLAWAGVEFDEGPTKGGNFGPYIQSERFVLYKEYAQKLIDSANAYYAFDTPEELEAMRERLQNEKKAYKYDRPNMKNQFTLEPEKIQELLAQNCPYVIRLKVPENVEVVFDDIIRGTVKVHTSEVDDQILLKSDGFPTYHLANVVDDYLMQITDVIRGEEWLPSTPKHCLLYDAFGWKRPRFAHLPLLLNKDKSKLSKRHGHVSVEEFRADGYLKDALVNFVALLGWNPSADRDLFNIDELIEHFALDKVNKGGAVFDLQKLEWFNAQYLRQKSDEELAAMLIGELEKKNISSNIDYCIKVIHLFKERISFIRELPDMADYMFEEPQNYEEEYFKKHWKPETKRLSGLWLEAVKQFDDFSHSGLYEFTKTFCENNSIKLKELIHPLRLMVTGKSAGAGMFETMEALGRDKIFQRISTFIEKN